MKILKKVLFIVISGLYVAAYCKDMPTEPLYQESLRPQFHFTARYWDDYQLNPPNHHEGWINDINGLVYNKGEYHLFAQRWWSAWLHAISTDLIHWKEYRPAFGKGGRFGGTQSGGGVVDINNTSGLGDGLTPPMLAFWSSTDNESQCMSYSLDNGRTWSKYEKNPVLLHKYRDPKVFWYKPDQKWIMILYGPADNRNLISRYGFNGENNDAHDLREYEAGQWMYSVIRVLADGTVIATDQNGSSSGKIDIERENVASSIFTVGAKENRSELLEGEISELLVYDRALTENEVRATINILQRKQVTALNKPFVKEGMVLRLSASNAAADSEGKLSIWKDLSHNGNNLVQPDLECQPRLISNIEELPGSCAVRFDGKQFMQGDAVLSEGDDDFTFVAVWRRDHLSGSEVICEQNSTEKDSGRRASILTISDKTSENVYLMFTSNNLLDWTKLDVNIQDSFECPDMFELPLDNNFDNKKWVIIDGNGDYVLGQFDGKNFTVEATKKDGDYGRNFYATMTFENMPEGDPRRVQIAWMRGWDDYPKNMPFNQQVTFPCELTLRQIEDEFVLCRYPIDEIENIYNKTVTIDNRIVGQNNNLFSDVDGELFDIDIELDANKSTCKQFKLMACGNEISYDFENGKLLSAGSQVDLPVRDGKIAIRILVDRLSVETYGNYGEVSITNIAYQNKQAPSIKLAIIGGSAYIAKMEINKLESIWK